MNISVLKIILTLIIAAFSQNAFGYSFATNATIDKIHTEIMNPGKAYLTVSNITGKPGCATHTLYDYTIDTTTVGGENMLAVAMTALASGKLVSIKGNGVCTHSPTIEDIRHFIFLR